MYNDKNLIARISEALQENDAPRQRSTAPEIAFSDPSTDKVIAQLRAYKSGSYTRLGQNLQRIEELTNELKTLKDEVKQAAREDIIELFSVEDAIKTRVVQTKSFIFVLSKDPKPTETYKYAQILEELQSELTPELLQVLEALKAKYKTVTQKEPSLRLAKKSDKLNENLVDRLKNFVYKFFQWAKSYDRRLASLKQSSGLVTEAEYQGRKVTLNKPMKGDVKKSKVYVKDSKTGNVKKVNFGDPDMKIRKNNPEARKSFRARHNCDDANDKTTPRYWSCKAW